MKTSKIIKAHNKALAILRVIEFTEREIATIKERQGYLKAFDFEDKKHEAKLNTLNEKLKAVTTIYDNQLSRILNLQNPSK